jgi:hypothetical protein
MLNIAGRKTVSADMSGLYRSTNTYFSDLIANEEIILELDLDGKGTTLARGYFRVNSTSQSGDAGSQEDFSVSTVLSTPESVKEPFNWFFDTTSDAPEGFKILMNQWLLREPVYFEYLPEGVGAKGYEGSGYVSDASISVSVDSIAEMSVSLTGNGELVVINA